MDGREPFAVADEDHDPLLVLAGVGDGARSDGTPRRGRRVGAMGRGQIEIYVDRAGYWRWRFRARNGRILAVGSESYDRRGGALQGARLTVGRWTRVIDVEWHDEMTTLDPFDEAQRSLDRATRNTDRAEKRAQSAQERLDELRGLTGLDG